MCIAFSSPEGGQALSHLDVSSHWQSMLADSRSAPQADLAMFFVANRELMDLAQVSLHEGNFQKEAWSEFSY